VGEQLLWVVAAQAVALQAHPGRLVRLALELLVKVMQAVAHRQIQVLVGAAGQAVLAVLQPLQFLGVVVRQQTVPSAELQLHMLAAAAAALINLE
jgi:hypothetical protein